MPNDPGIVREPRPLEVEMVEALQMARSALEGRYPWPVAGRYTQKEARESALGFVVAALRRYRAEKGA